MRACDRCGATDGTIRRTRIFPADFTPTGCKCGCAYLCYACRSLGVAQRPPRVLR